MKRQTCLIFLFFFISKFAQAQDIPPAPLDKAVVYFVRSSSYGFAINFSYFDSTKLIGRFNGPKYIRYECNPGKHLFWARSENKDFIEAELEAGKIYFVEAVVRMGILFAEVELMPIDPSKTKKMKKVLKFVKGRPSESFSSEQLELDSKELEYAVTKGFEKYAEEIKRGVVNKRLLKTMFYPVE